LEFGEVRRMLNSRSTIDLMAFVVEHLLSIICDLLEQIDSAGRT